MENFLSCFRLAQCYVTINSVKQQWQHFIRSLDSERRKRQHLKNQVQWYGRRESKHLCSAYNVRSRVQQPMFGERHNALLLLSKPPQRRQSGAAAHDFGSLHRKEKAPEVSPRLCVMGLLVLQDWDRGSTAMPPKPDGGAGTPYVLN